MSPTVHHLEQFATGAADFILAEARRAITERGLFRVALSGGNTPRAVHAELVRRAGDLPWDRVQITFGDERCVPPEDPQSNYRMAKESLLDAVPIPPGNVFRMRGEIAPQAAADEYERLLAAVAARFGEARYAHDLLLLGLGEDGHTASLFPRSPALEVTDSNVIPATGPKPPPQRLTFTFPLINAARQVAFLVNDPAKQPIIDRIIAGQGGEFPASRVQPSSGAVTWLLGK